LSFHPLLRLPTFVIAMGTSLAFAQTNVADTIKLNQIQVIGSHNSYHAGIAPNEAKVWRTKYPDSFNGLDYSHPALTKQFDEGVRQIELDVYADTKGGLYAHPSGPSTVAAAGFSADPDFDPSGIMNKPRFKVMHIQDLDYRSNCQPFTACLTEVRKWSHAHPGHVPIFILIETKQGSPKNLKLTVPEPFTPATFDALDTEIRSVFPSSEMITPDDVRGSFATLEEAIFAGNWPTLANGRGKVIFLMDQHSVGPVYLGGHPSLRGRVLFTNSDPGLPDAAFLERNEGPVADINGLVRKGYLVRARTDSDTKEARTNDTTNRDAMMQSGAQILSTDYPMGEPAHWPGNYVVTFKEGRDARCNPINAPKGCDSSLIGKPIPR
jgi:hypothetical protein